PGYSGGSLFVDHASKHVHVEFQEHFNAPETISALKAYERLCHDSGVIPQAFVTDNGASFQSKAFMEHLARNEQSIRYAGAGSHHQNGLAERTIQTIMAMARTMMLNAAIHWPEVADATLWPLAVQHSVWLWNHLPDPSNGLSPIDIWSKSRWPLRKLHDVHVFGCPIYVLAKRISDGKKVGKWEPRSSRMINVGFSPLHSSSVPLALNPATGYITPQWNVVFDDSFSTISSTAETLPDFMSPAWMDMFGDATFVYPTDELDDIGDESDVPVESNQRADTVGKALWDRQPTRAKQETQPVAHNQLPVTKQLPVGSITPAGSSLKKSVHQRELPSVEQRERRVSFHQQRDLADINEHPSKKSSIQPYVTATSPIPSTTQAASHVSPTPLPPTPTVITTTVPDQVPTPVKQPVVVDPVPSSVDRMRPTRRRAPVVKYEPGESGMERGTTSAEQWKSTSVNIVEDRVIPSMVYTCMDVIEDVDNSFHAFYSNAKLRNPDIFTYDAAMRDVKNHHNWIAAMESEIKSLEQKGCWSEVPLSSLSNEPITPLTWVFRVKRSPDGEIRKFKARLCLR
ncbi:MAG: hypothetical protein AAGM67_06790, partial [Bacteroidota bacterium]